MKISILTPTKERPKNIERLVKSIALTASGQHELELLFYVDMGDGDSEAAIMNLAREMPQHISLKYLGDIGNDDAWYNKWWNYLWTNSTGDIIMQSGDDLEFKTLNWDDSVVKAFARYPDKMAVVYCNDGSGASHQRATHPFLSKEWCDLLGYMVPGVFDGAYNDTWLTELGKMTGRFVHLENVFIDHLHPDFGLSVNDFVYDKQREMCRKQDSRKLFQDTIEDRKKDSQKILNYIEDFTSQLGQTTSGEK